MRWKKKEFISCVNKRGKGNSRLSNLLRVRFASWFLPGCSLCSDSLQSGFSLCPPLLKHTSRWWERLLSRCSFLLCLQGLPSYSHIVFSCPMFLLPGLSVFFVQGVNNNRCLLVHSSSILLYTPEGIKSASRYAAPSETKLHCQWALRLPGHSHRLLPSRT